MKNVTYIFIIKYQQCFSGTSLPNIIYFKIKIFDYFIKRKILARK